LPPRRASRTGRSWASSGCGSSCGARRSWWPPTRRWSPRASPDGGTHRRRWCRPGRRACRRRRARTAPAAVRRWGRAASRTVCRPRSRGGSCGGCSGPTCCVMWSSIATGGLPAAHAGDAYPFYEVALERQEDDEDGQHHEQADRHEPVPGRRAAGRELELPETQLERVEPLALEVDEGAHEVLPCPLEAEYRDRRERGLGQGHDDVPDDAQLRGPVDLGALRELHRDPTHELTQEEDVERAAGERGHDEGQERVDPRLRPLETEGRQASEDDELRDHEYDARHHHGGQDDAEEDVTSGPLETCECVRHHGR